MSEVSWEIIVKERGGHQISESDTLIVEACGKIDKIIKGSETDIQIEVQPADTKQLQFILITASKYQGDKLFYTLKTGNDAEKITLDAPQFFIGAGMLELLDPSPKNIYVTNNLDEEVTLNILVGRDVTPTA